MTKWIEVKGKSGLYRLNEELVVDESSFKAAEKSLKSSGSFKFLCAGKPNVVIRGHKSRQTKEERSKVS